MVNITQIINDGVDRYNGGEQMKRFMQRIAHVESTNNPRAVNSESGATGLFQQTGQNWTDYGNGGDRNNPVHSTDAAVRFALNNKKVLVGILDREPTPGEYYLAHFAGPGGARNVLQADDATPIKNLLGAKAMYQNRGITFEGKTFAQFTAHDLERWATSKMGGKLAPRDRYADWSVNESGITDDADPTGVIKRRKFAESIGANPQELGSVDFSNPDEFFAFITITIIGEFFPALKQAMGGTHTSGPEAVPTQSDPKVAVRTTPSANSHA